MRLKTRPGTGDLAELSGLESVDDRMIGMMRLILALSALIIIYIDPSEPDHFVVVTYTALVVYGVYSSILYFSLLRDNRLLPSSITHWIDVGCYLVLIALSSGTNSIFFFFFFFAILIASFRRGFKAGLQVTIISTLMFTLIGLTTTASGPNFELNRFLLRPTYLLVIGYMMAYWGNSEITLKRRLSLLKEIPNLSHPRYGIERVLATVMQRLRKFYDADLCLLVYFDPQARGHRLIRIEREGEAAPARAERIPDTLAQLLLALPGELAAVYNGERRPRFLKGLVYYAFDTSKNMPAGAGREACKALAAQVEAGSLVTIPVCLPDKSFGRLCLTLGRRPFTKQDVDFLLQIIEQVRPILDNTHLLERLASSAAEHERHRLARDLHDSVVQPYIGLQYKLAAIRNKAESGAVAQDIERLFQFTVDEISNLRGFVGGLKQTGGQRDDLASALQRFAGQFAQSYDISVNVECKGSLDLSDRLAAEIIQIVHEGLSNIRKHTQATSATVELESTGSHLALRIENDTGNEAAPDPFRPGSITERAEEMGGRVRVNQNPNGWTVVGVEIPL